MARIEWAHLCELAFLDRYDRLSMIGVTTFFRVPSLPIAVRKIMMVAKITAVRGEDDMDLGVSISTPRGEWTQPNPSGLELEQAGEYLFVTLHDVPLGEAGTHRFVLELGQQELVVEIPVTVMSTPDGVSLH